MVEGSRILRVIALTGLLVAVAGAPVDEARSQPLEHGRIESRNVDVEVHVDLVQNGRREIDLAAGQQSRLHDLRHPCATLQPGGTTS
jgi:hypothetical protein